MSDKLHFMRVRQDTSPVFVDPLADIKHIGELMMLAITEFVQRMDDIPEEDANKLASIFQVFTMRLVEDPQPLVEQLADFQKAFMELPDNLQSRVYVLVAVLGISLYALFMRRDGKLDGTEVYKPMSSAMMLAASLSQLSPEDNQAFRDLLQSSANALLSPVSLPDMARTMLRVDAVAVEEGKRVQDIKTAALMAIGADPTIPWSKACELCDKYFLASCTGDESADNDSARIATALAFPDYSVPVTAVTVNKS